MLAVFEKGGKQYLVRPEEIVCLEKIKGEKGEKVVFDKVLLFFDGKNLFLGKPYLANVKVEGEIIAQKRSKKIVVFRYKPKTRYRKKKSQRRYLTEVKIKKIVS